MIDAGRVYLLVCVFTIGLVAPSGFHTSVQSTPHPFTWLSRSFVSWLTCSSSDSWSTTIRSSCSRRPVSWPSSTPTSPASSASLSSPVRVYKNHSQNVRFALNREFHKILIHPGGEITSTFDHPELVKLGHCKLIEEVMIGEDTLIHFSGVAMGTHTQRFRKKRFKSASHDRSEPWMFVTVPLN